MRMAGRFARRVKAWAGADGVPVIHCKAGERRHLLAEEYLERHPVGLGVRAALAGALALAPARHGFTAAEFAARVCQMTRHDGYTIPQASYHLRKLRGKNLIGKPGRTRRYQVPPGAARTIAGLPALHDYVIGPVLAGIRTPARAQARPPDPHRRRLPDPPRRHAGPLSRPRHRDAASSRIDNILSMGEMQAARPQAPTVPAAHVNPVRSPNVWAEILAVAYGKLHRADLELRRFERDRSRSPEES
jgi:DNA-binding transcriptional ArsR family regulator